jgi:peptide/nickel transport system substrate-binding protein
VTLSTRNVEGYRDAAVIAISQLGEIYIDGQLELIETANWFPRVIRKDYTVGVTVAEGGLDEPDQKFYETYVCGADRNYTGYCNEETDRLIDRQSMEADPEKRRKLVWEVERRLADDASRPVLLYSRFATCMQPRLNGLTTMTNSRFDGWRMENVSLDKITPLQIEGEADDAEASDACSDSCATDLVAGRWANVRTKAGRDSEDVSFRQPGQPVAA